jgi:hypothetical protein
MADVASGGTIPNVSGTPAPDVSAAIVEGGAAGTGNSDTNADAGTAGANGKIEAPNWFDGLSDEYKTSDSFKDFKGKDVSELAKAHLELQKAKDDITKQNEELSAKLPRVPENADGYTLDIPKGLPVDPAFVSTMKEAAHKAGVGQEQLEALAAPYIASQKAFMDQVAKNEQDGIEALKIEWGSEFESKSKLVQQTFRKFASDSEFQYFEDTRLGSNPTLVRLMEKIGKAISEDYVPPSDGGGQGGGGESPTRRDGRPMFDYSKSMGSNKKGRK